MAGAYSGAREAGVTAGKAGGGETAGARSSQESVVGDPSSPAFAAFALEGLITTAKKALPPMSRPFTAAAARPHSAAGFFKAAARKTYRERRGWLMALRNYGSMAVLHAIMLHVLLLIAAGQLTLSAVSTLVPTHSICIAVLRACHAWSTTPAPTELSQPLTSSVQRNSPSNRASSMSARASLRRGPSDATVRVTVRSFRANPLQSLRAQPSHSQAVARALYESTKSLQRAFGALKTAGLASQHQHARAAVVNAAALAGLLTLLCSVCAYIPQLKLLWIVLAGAYGSLWVFQMYLLVDAGHMDSVLENVPSWLGGTGDAGARVGWLYREMKVPRMSLLYSVALCVASLLLKAWADYYLLVRPAFRASLDVMAPAGVAAGRDATLRAVVIAAHCVPAAVMFVADTFLWSTAVHCGAKVLGDMWRHGLSHSQSWHGLLDTFWQSSLAFTHKCVHRDADAAKQLSLLAPELTLVPTLVEPADQSALSRALISLGRGSAPGLARAALDATSMLSVDVHGTAAHLEASASSSAPALGPAFTNVCSPSFRLVWDTCVQDLYVRDQLSRGEKQGLLHQSLSLPAMRDSDAALFWESSLVPPPFFLAGSALTFVARGESSTRGVAGWSVIMRAFIALGISLQILKSADAATLLTLLLVPSEHSFQMEQATLDGLRAACAALHSAFERASTSAQSAGVAAQDAAAILVEQIIGVGAQLDVQLANYSAWGSMCGRILRSVLDDLSRDAIQDALAAKLRAVTPEDPPSETSRETNVRALARVLHCCFCQSADDFIPKVAAAREALCFFSASLQSPEVTVPDPIPAMSSHSILTPVYAEDVQYALSAAWACQRVGCKGDASTGRTLADLMVTNDAGVTTLEYIRSVHSHEWRHFAERVAAATPDITAAHIEHASSSAHSCPFLPKGSLHELAGEVEAWATRRGQLLGRTVKGLLLYEQALRVHCKLEGTPEETGMAKFQYVVACQNYAQQKVSSEPAQRWLAYGVEELQRQHPSLQVAYIEKAKGGSQVSVLRGYDASRAQAYEMYRIRLPHNTSSTRGIILGEGKGENQNHAIIFTRGECIQVIDMNQDNTLTEAFKMRHVTTSMAEYAAQSGVVAALMALEEVEAEAPVRDVAPVTEVIAISPSAAAAEPAKPDQPPSPQSGHPSAEAVLTCIAELKRERQELYMASLAEGIFSGVAGAMANMSATMELSFQALYATYAQAGAKAHYGHPDIMNKLFVITRGGLSKATKEIHVSEDVFGAFNHTLRGGRMEHFTYTTVQKGRDLAIESINLFETKISRGQIQVWCSRDMFRLMELLDPFRQFHFTYAYRHAGHFFGSWGTFAALSLHIWSRLVVHVVLAGARPAPHSAPAVPVLALAQLLCPMLIPFLTDRAVKVGLRAAALEARGHLARGWPLFVILMERTKAWHVWDSMTHGGSSYLPTGRRFGIHHYPFTRLFMMFARSHLWFGAQLGVILVLLWGTHAASGARMSITDVLEWGCMATVAAACLAGPVLFNPFSFDLATLKGDVGATAVWLGLIQRPVSYSNQPEAGGWLAYHERERGRLRADNTEGAARLLRLGANVGLQLLLVTVAISQRALLGTPLALLLALLSLGQLADVAFQGNPTVFAEVEATVRWLGDIFLASNMLLLSAMLSLAPRVHRSQLQVLFGTEGMRGMLKERHE